MRRQARILWVICSIALLVWLFSSWLLVNSLQNSRADALIREHSAAISQQAENIQINISRHLETLHGIPTVVARDGEVVRALQHSGITPVEQRKQVWSRQFAAVDDYLNAVALSLGSDVVYVMNTAGDCIASSNVGKPDSFVGANYASREYFKAAMEGQSGNQYAVGKTSKLPGLYFSAPVVENGRIIGAVAVKINMSALAHWVNQTDAFVTDQHGVIILSSDVKLEMKSMPDAPIAKLSKDARINRYRREEFPALSLGAWPDDARLHRFDTEPVLLSGKSLPKDNVEIHVYKKLPEIVELRQEKMSLFLLTGISGALAILFIGARISYNQVRRQNERALRSSEEQLREAQMIAGLGSYALDLNTGSWECSDMLNRLLGIEGEYERTLDGWRALIHPADRAMIDDYFREEVLAKGRVFDREYRIIRPDNQQERWIHQLGKPIFDAQRHPVRVQGTLEDISQRVHTQDELRRARDEAETANRTKSVFLANMSHELRTPLNAIIGYSEMLEEDAADEGREDFVQDLRKIKHAGKNLLELINDVLDLSKIEAGKIELYAEHFDLGVMSQQLVSTLQPLLNRNGNTLQLNLADNLGQAYTDQTKLRQVLLNLLSNACKFTEAGQVVFKVERRQQSGADWLIFSITDSGIGMSPEQMGRLFQAFSQADASTTRKYGGTGLGLMISRHFCHMLGGEIEVNSSEGKGSTFTVSIPAVLPQQHPPEPVQHAAPPLPVSDARATVLVIDDDPNARDLLSRLLCKEGFFVECASGGEEGLRLAGTFKPDIITLDAMMPDKDGWTVLSALKDDPNTAAIPVIMLTMMDNQNLGFSLGAADYLNKPVSRERLLDTVMRHLGQRDGSILIVEDDVSSRQMLKRALEHERWPVVEAENGRVALECIREQIPALILLDLMMPEMDGFQVVEQLHGNEAWRSIPVVVITAKDLTREDMERLNGSVLKIVQKGSYSQADLLNQVRALVK